MDQHVKKMVTIERNRLLARMEACPRSPEGRILGFILSIYAFSVFGYVTATLASYFIGRDKKTEGLDQINKNLIEILEKEIRALREDISKLNDSGKLN